MRILHIIYDDLDNPWVGGGGALRAREINSILAQKHRITVLSGNYPGAEDEVAEGVEYQRVGTSVSYFLSRISFALKIPFLLRKYDYDLIVNEFSVFSPCFCDWYTRKTVIHTFYHRIGKQAFKKIPVFGFLAYLFERLFFATAKYVITISPSVTREVEKFGKQKELRCIYTGVSDDIFSVKPNPGKYIAFIGRLDIYMKGIDLLLEAYSRLDDKTLPLKIAGSGPDKNRASLEELTEKLNLTGSVSFLGRISDEEKKDFLADASFLVMPSRFEGWGIVAVEAAACGKAVIGTDIPGLSDAIIDGKTGILVEPDNVEMLAEAIKDLMKDTARQNTMGLNGKDWAKNFKWDAIAENQENFYLDVQSKQ